MVEEETREVQSQSLQGKRFVFTGTLERWGRTEAKRIVESLGGVVSSQVSGNTDYVVVGSKPGSKADKARQLGVPMLTEEEFEVLIAKGE